MNMDICFTLYFDKKKRSSKRNNYSKYNDLDHPNISEQKMLKPYRISGNVAILRSSIFLSENYSISISANVAVCKRRLVANTDCTLK